MHHLYEHMSIARLFVKCFLLQVQQEQQLLNSLTAMLAAKIEIFRGSCYSVCDYIVPVCPISNISSVTTIKGVYGTYCTVYAGLSSCMLACTSFSSLSGNTLKATNDRFPIH